jgi:hypothetical protein
MHVNRTAAQEAVEDIYFGQVVLIWTRWFVILAVAILSLWAAKSTSELAGMSLLIVGMMGLNFFLHARSLMDRPANQRLLIGSSLVDLVIAGAIVATWQGGGLENQYFVLYYPILFAFALVFPPRLTATFAILALGSYVAICLVDDPSIVANAADAKVLVQRLITLGAMAGLGTYYWRIQRDRRRVASTQTTPQDV